MFPVESTLGRRARLEGIDAKTAPDGAVALARATSSGKAAVTEERRARMQQLLEQNRYSAALQAATNQLGDLGITLGRDDALTREAVQSALDAVEEQARYHFIWHRIWGGRLRSEVIATTTQLASRLEGERAVLVWGYPTAVAFLVDVPLVLKTLPGQIGPEPDDLLSGGIGSDILVVADDGDSGLQLGYKQYPHADEYWLHPWGRYAFSLEE
jgi:hypothetical protein